MSAEDDTPEETAAQETPAAESKPDETAQQPAAESPGPAASAGKIPMPPAKLETLILMLSSQAFFAMGLVPHPETGKTDKDLAVAQHLIDLLGVLEEKTKGNRTPDEIKLLSQTLHELRMTFVQVNT